MIVNQTNLLNEDRLQIQNLDHILLGEDVMISTNTLHQILTYAATGTVH
jgi:hypothetical protein